MIPFRSKSVTLSMLIDLLTRRCRSTQVKLYTGLIASIDLWPQEMFTFSEMLALVQSESSFGAYVCHRRPAGLHSDQRSCLAHVDDPCTAVLLFWKESILVHFVIMKASSSADTRSFPMLYIVYFGTCSRPFSWMLCVCCWCVRCSSTWSTDFWRYFVRKVSCMLSLFLLLLLLPSPASLSLPPSYTLSFSFSLSLSLTHSVSVSIHLSLFLSIYHSHSHSPSICLINLSHPVFFSLPWPFSSLSPCLFAERQLQQNEFQDKFENTPLKRPTLLEWLENSPGQWKKWIKNRSRKERKEKMALCNEFILLRYSCEVVIMFPFFVLVVFVLVLVVLVVVFVENALSKKHRLANSYFVPSLCSIWCHSGAGQHWGGIDSFFAFFVVLWEKFLSRFFF